ncbi:Periplasmic trehalase [Ralstonia syzygii subsp. syzygii]|nr:Periplasmic trehalase [Ralstonia syzygii subsp. syzygii]
MLEPLRLARPFRSRAPSGLASATIVRRMTAAALLAASLCALSAGADVGVGAALPPSLDKLYGELFVAVQTAQVYPDQKTFVDTVPKADPAVILQAYRAQKDVPGFSLKAFVDQYFTVLPETSVTPPAGLSLRAHINWLCAGAHAHHHHGAGQQLADSAAQALCGAGRALPRGLLLGHVFHDARAAGGRAR